jgi:rubredoxin
MKRFQCSVCGYFYDMDLGDPDGGAPSGTAFKDVITSWACPICGAGKEDFHEDAVGTEF